MGYVDDIQEDAKDDAEDIVRAFDAYLAAQLDQSATKAMLVATREELLSQIRYALGQRDNRRPA